MLEIENTEVIGLKAAIRGIRDPMNPWEKSDSGICFDTIACHTCRADRNHCKSRMKNKEFVVGYDIGLQMEKILSWLTKLHINF